MISSTSALLIGAEFADRDADRLERADIRLVLGDVVGQRAGLKDRHGAAGARPASAPVPWRPPPRVPSPATRRPSTLARRPKERRHGDLLAHYGEVAREMVPLEAPAPRLRGAGRAKHA